MHGADMHRKASTCGGEAGMYGGANIRAVACMGESERARGQTYLGASMCERADMHGVSKDTFGVQSWRMQRGPGATRSMGNTGALQCLRLLWCLSLRFQSLSQNHRIETERVRTEAVRVQAEAVCVRTEALRVRSEAVRVRIKPYKIVTKSRAV